MRSIPRPLPTPTRSGLAYIPLLALTLLVVTGAVAVALNRTWLSAAKSELSSGSTSAALAAAGHLTGDDLLKPGSSMEDRLDEARAKAIAIAHANRVGTQSIRIAESQVQFGQIEVDSSTGIRTFTVDEDHPSAVVVTAARTRAGANPVAMVLDSVAKTGGADVVVISAATIDNRVLGMRPLSNLPIPAVPLSILHDDPTDTRTDTWRHTIVDGHGSDLYGYDDEQNIVTDIPDGIREMTLTIPDSKTSGDPQNVALLEVYPSDVTTDPLPRQIKSGWSVDDLTDFDGELRIGNGETEDLTASIVFDSSLIDALHEQIGKPRLFLLHVGFNPDSATNPTTGVVRCSRFVACRIMSIDQTGDGTRLVVQPTVMTTPTALLPLPTDEPTTPPEHNPYIYKLQLAN